MEEGQERFVDEQQVLELGIVLGQRRAFGLVAGRCSAAQAECLRKIRDEKAYLKFAPNWEEFCTGHLKIGKRTADRTIALLKKHGTLYFEVAALTGITPADFARIAFAIQKDGIHMGGDVIALIPENAARALDAVAHLKTQDAAPAGPASATASAEAQIRGLKKRGRQLCEGFREVAKIVGPFEWGSLAGTLKELQKSIARLGLEIR
jgi:hypothetical protein